MGVNPLHPFTRSAALLALVLGTVLSFTVTYYSLSQPSEESFWADLRGERLRQDLGFATGLVPIPDRRDANDAPLRIFGITYVVPGGRFARAGVRAADLPVALSIPGYGHSCPKQWEWIRGLCQQYLAGPCLITGLGAAVRQEQVGVMFYSTLFRARSLGQFRFSVVPATALAGDGWRGHTRSVEVVLTGGPV